jgi:hypothetical protein
VPDRDDSDPPYPVGYKRPPPASQFKPGQSGNPNGRPKGAKNFATVLQEELNTAVTVTENGKRRKISKRQAVAKQLVNSAATGNAKAIPVLLKEIRFRESLHPVESDRPSKRASLFDIDLKSLSDEELVALYRQHVNGIIFGDD